MKKILKRRRVVRKVKPSTFIVSHECINGTVLSITVNDREELFVSDYKKQDDSKDGAKAFCELLYEIIHKFYGYGDKYSEEPTNIAVFPTSGRKASTKSSLKAYLTHEMLYYDDESLEQIDNLIHKGCTKEWLMNLFKGTPEDKQLELFQEGISYAPGVFGYVKQVQQTIEELAELLVAVSHYKRGKADAKKVAEEICGANIMLEQLINMIKPRSFKSLASNHYDIKLNENELETMKLELVMDQASFIICKYLDEIACYGEDLETLYYILIDVQMHVHRLAYRFKSLGADISFIEFCQIRKLLNYIEKKRREDVGGSV